MKKSTCTASIRDDAKSLVVGEYVKGKLVNPSKVEYVTHCVNHVYGCPHDCKYCYAYAGERVHGRVKCREEWQKIRLVRDVAARVGRELDRKRSTVDRIHLCLTADPFPWDAAGNQLVPEIAAATIELIEAINARGIPVTVITKGVYPDLDVRALHPDNQYGITVVSLNEGFMQEWERGAPPVGSRIEGLRSIAEQGAWTWVSVEPYPTPNLDPSAGDANSLLDELGFIDKFIFGRLNYTPEVTAYLKTDPEFYLRVARQVESWCQANGKPLHIKASTPLHRPETANILAVDARPGLVAEDAA